MLLAHVISLVSQALYIEFLLCFCRYLAIASAMSLAMKITSLR